MLDRFRAPIVNVDDCPGLYSCELGDHDFVGATSTTVGTSTVTRAVSVTLRTALVVASAVAVLSTGTPLKGHEGVRSAGTRRVIRTLWVAPAGMPNCGSPPSVPSGVRKEASSVQGGVSVPPTAHPLSPASIGAEGGVACRLTISNPANCAGSG